MTGVTIREAAPGNAREVFDLVEALLAELGEEGEETGLLDREALRRAWQSDAGRFSAFVAWRGETPVGVATVAEAFAFYAGGAHGTINEMYVMPGHRSGGVGALLIEAVKTLGRRRGWRRIDVTAPESERWARTRRFYEQQGFRFTGPKLKCLLQERDEG